MNRGNDDNQCVSADFAAVFREVGSSPSTLTLSVVAAEAPTKATLFLFFTMGSIGIETWEVLGSSWCSFLLADVHIYMWYSMVACHLIR